MQIAWVASESSKVVNGKPVFGGLFCVYSFAIAPHSFLLVRQLRDFR